MRVFIAAIVFVLASGTSFAKEVVCSGTGAASSISTVPRDVPPVGSQDLGLLISNCAFFVGYRPKTMDKQETLSIARHNRTDDSTIVATGSTSGTVEMIVSDGKSNNFKITCVVIHDFRE
jgi:hypothetical protein